MFESTIDMLKSMTYDNMTRHLLVRKHKSTLSTQNIFTAFSNFPFSLFSPSHSIYSCSFFFTLSLSVWEVAHSWAFAVCWRAVRRSRRHWRWPARETLLTLTNWWKISTEETTSALAFRALLLHPGECDKRFTTFLQLTSATVMITFFMHTFIHAHCVHDDSMFQMAQQL